MTSIRSDTGLQSAWKGLLLGECESYLRTRSDEVFRLGVEWEGVETNKIIISQMTGLRPRLSCLSIIQL